MNDKSRMKGDFHVRFREKFEVKVLLLTRLRGRELISLLLDSYMGLGGLNGLCYSISESRIYYLNQHFCCALYSSPQFRIASRSGFRLYPKSVNYILPVTNLHINSTNDKKGSFQQETMTQYCANFTGIVKYDTIKQQRRNRIWNF